MLQNRDFPAWLVGLLLAVGCATAENSDAPDNRPTTSASGKGGSAAAGSAGKAGLGGGGSSGAGGTKAGSSSGGNAPSGKGGTGTGGNAEGGSPDQQGGTSQGGLAGSGAGGSGNGGMTAGSSQGGKGGSGGSAGSTAGTGGGGATLDCDDPLYLLCDDFEDGNASGWSTSGGTWAVVQSGSYVYKGASGGYQAFAGDAGMTDQVVEAKLSSVVFGGTGSSHRAGIIARRTSTSNFYTVVLDAAGDLRLLKGSSSPSGSSGTCAAAQVSPGASFTLRLAVTGAAGSVNLKTYLDGNQVHDCTSTSGTLASGSAGVYTYGSNSVAEFDDFKVSVP